MEENQLVNTGDAKVIIGGQKVQTVNIKGGTSFEGIFSMIRMAGFKDARVRTFDPQTNQPIEIYMSNPPATFEAGRTYEITPYDRPGF